MNNLVCPHCRSDVPRGARVCTGCKAEVEYGASPRATIQAALAAAVLAGLLFTQIPHVPWWVAVLAAVGAFFGATYLYATYFADRIVFYRHYRGGSKRSSRR